MNTEQLAQVYLDNKPIALNDPKPKVSAILSAGGKPETVEVKWLTSKSDANGRVLRASDFVDRTSTPGTAIYLTSQARGQSGGAKGSDKEMAGKASQSHTGSGSNVRDDALDADRSSTARSGAGDDAALDADETPRTEAAKGARTDSDDEDAESSDKTRFSGE